MAAIHGSGQEAFNKFQRKKKSDYLRRDEIFKEWCTFACRKIGENLPISERFNVIYGNEEESGVLKVISQILGDYEKQRKKYSCW